MELATLREELDQIDSELTQLFIKRMNISARIAEYKKQSNMPVWDNVRELEILNRVANAVGDKLETYARRLFSTLFDMSKSYQNQLMNPGSQLAKDIKAASRELTRSFPSKATVACQGTAGSYSQQACEKLFSMPNPIFFHDFDGVFQAVDQGLCEYGLLPVENSLAGTIVAVYDLMEKYKFYIARSVRIKINHTLVAKKGTVLADIKEIVSHEQAISQCSNFIKARPEIKVTMFSNTAAAARYVAESNRKDLAAIAAGNCAELYNLSVIAEDIQNRDSNYTRFICISKDLQIYPGANKISIMLTLPHKPGSLCNLLSKFYSLGLNLTKLESRPIAGSDFEFLFYFDFEGSVYSRETVNLLSELENSLAKFIFLGSYSEIF